MQQDASNAMERSASTTFENLKEKEHAMREDHLIDFANEDELHDELMRSYQEEVGGQGQAFSVDTMDKASWASRKLLDAEQRRRRVKAWAEREMARIRKIAEKHEAEIEQGEGFLKGELQMYLRRLRESGELKKKSMTLPGGDIGLRSGRDKIVLEDEEAVIRQLEAKGEEAPIKIKKSILKTPLSRITTSQGGRLYLGQSQLEGCFVEPAEESFYFKPEGLD